MDELAASRVRRSRGQSFWLALLALLLPHSARAQLAATSAPSACYAPGTQAPTDPNATTPVVVRLTASASARPRDAQVARVLGTRISRAMLMLTTQAPLPAALLGQPANSGTIRWVVAGEAERTKDSVTLRWTISDVRTGARRGSGTASGAFLDLDGFAERSVTAIARQIGYSSIPPHTVERTQRATSADAFEQYIAGIAEYDSFDPTLLRRATAALQQSVALDASYAPAWLALAQALTSIVEWGEGPTANGRSLRSRDALAAVARALAIAPRDTRAIALQAHLHLLRDDVKSAMASLEQLRAASPNDESLAWLNAELAMVRGDDPALLPSLVAIDVANSRSVRGLYLRGEWERRTGRLGAACSSFNRLLLVEPNWAPAYVQRSLVRSALGDQRGGWQDAEMATRLGRPAWGELASALIDYSVSDSLRTRDRLRRVQGMARGTVHPWLDVLLEGAVLRASGEPDLARRALSTAACDEPRRRLFAVDPLLRDVAPGKSTCLASVGLPNPAKDFRD